MSDVGTSRRSSWGFHESVFAGYRKFLDAADVDLEADRDGVQEAGITATGRLAPANRRSSGDQIRAGHLQAVGISGRRDLYAWGEEVVGR